MPNPAPGTARWHHLRWPTPTGRGNGLRFRTVRVRIPRSAPILWSRSRTGTCASFRPKSLGVRISPRLPLSRPYVSGRRRPSQGHDAGSIPAGRSSLIPEVGRSARRSAVTGVFEGSSPSPGASFGSSGENHLHRSQWVRIPHDPPVLPVAQWQSVKLLISASRVRFPAGKPFADPRWDGSPIDRRSGGSPLPGILCLRNGFDSRRVQTFMESDPGRAPGPVSKAVRDPQGLEDRDLRSPPSVARSSIG